jgi:voltage-gated potassium channel
MSSRSDIPGLREHGNAYNIFILVLTIYSLAIIVLLLFPIPQPVRDLLNIYDDVVCVIFLADFAYNLAGSHPRSAYFIRARGWLDLLGSIPSFAGLQIASVQLTGLFRLARLSRLARITRILGGNNRRELVRDVVQNRGQYATFITILAAGIVLTTASVLVLQFESSDPDANIRSGGDALWWGIVTITTVGYGDRFPVTMLGRATGVAVMFAGVGIIGALASILASLLVSSPAETAEAAEAAEDGDETSVQGIAASAAGARTVPSSVEPSEAILARLDSLQAEVSALRSEIAARESPST